MTLQDRNAGNAGDQLKHALLTEVLARLPADAPWRYAETHAGAGAYRSPHAPELFRAAWAACGPPPTQGSADVEWIGGVYATSLCRWWLRQVGMAELPPTRVATTALTDVTYPGSAALVAISGLIHGEMVLAESDAKSMVRLQRTLSDVSPPEHGHGPDGVSLPCRRAHYREGSFEESMSEIAGTGRSVLLIDPYYYDSQATDGAGGRLGQRHLTLLLGPQEGRDAVAVIFASHRPRASLTVGEADRLRDGTWAELVGDMRHLAPPALRCFRVHETAHAVVVAGWGAGAGLVVSLPSPAVWQDSWLAQSAVGLQVVEEETAERGGPRT